MAMDETNPILSMAKLLKNANDPMAMLATAAQSNPQLKGVYDQVQLMNGNPEPAFYNLAKSKGMTEEQAKQFLNNIKSTWNGL